MKTAFIITCAWVLDAAIGDPESLPHPVRWIGSFITKIERIAREWFSGKKAAGVCIGILVPVTVYLGTLLIITTAAAISTLLGVAVSILILYYCLSTRCLADEAGSILESLRKGDLIGARKRLARIVGRDTESLDEQEVVRATVETVSENTVDGILSPLFFAAIGGAPLAMAYKAINTLDSMIGYRNEQYREIGWFSARLDDIVNFIPARLSLLLIPAAALVYDAPRAITALRIGIRDGHRSPSPNSGNPEACFAGALGIQLGGPSSYGGVVSRKPVLGDAERDIEIDDIQRAVTLMWLSSCAGLILFAAACM
jgi:adenosylcobinamide-phosphate synthase